MTASAEPVLREGIEIAGIRSALLTWYDEHARDLPWRGRSGEPMDPYRVWLSEVMLQQTRVDTVRPYYLRWVRRFPNLRSLAEASLDDVLREWEGLGYYSRARNFHSAVREVAARYDGRVPGDPDVFQSLPGVGRYTAGAVMSIAFGHEQPVVDGNVRRVYARLADEPAPRDRDMWRFAGALVRGSRPGDLNQAIMELGATVCTPRRPRCPECPVRRWCAAAAAGTVEERPERRPRAPLPKEVHGVAVVQAPDGRVLLARRPTNGRLGGMWEFPGVPTREREAPEAAASRAVAERTGMRAEITGELGSIIHTFTHVAVRYEAFLGRVEEAFVLPGNDVAWERLDGLRGFAMPVAQRKIVELVEDG